MTEDLDFNRVFKHGKAVFYGGIVLLVLIYVLSGIYSINPEQRGVVIRFGKIVDDNVPPGIHYSWPWPIERVLQPRTTEIRSLNVRFRDTKNNDFADTGGALLTGDENLVLAAIIVQYHIKDAKDFLTVTEKPEVVLKRIVLNSAILRFAETKVDDILTTGRQQLQVILKQEIQGKSDEYRLGIRITSVQLQNIEPPPKVVRSFKDVASAREDKHKKVKEAEGESNRRLPEARAEANRLIRTGEAFANEIVESAKGDANRFLANLEEYRKNRSVSAQRLYLEAMESILPKVKKMITNPEAEKKVQGGRFR